jgi:hypothetical protein
MAPIPILIRPRRNLEDGTEDACSDTPMHVMYESEAMACFNVLPS